MITYADMLVEAIETLYNKAEQLLDEAIALPLGTERDRITRNWYFTIGEVRGLELAVDLLRQYLNDCQQTLGDGDVHG